MAGFAGRVATLPFVFASSCVTRVPRMNIFFLFRFGSGSFIKIGVQEFVDHRSYPHASSSQVVPLVVGVLFILYGSGLLEPCGAVHSGRNVHPQYDTAVEWQCCLHRRQGLSTNVHGCELGPRRGQIIISRDVF